MVVSSLSAGLVLGPLLFAAIFRKFGDAIGASLAASTIGLGITGFALSNSALVMIISTFILGAANGVQNSLMSSYIMKSIDKVKRKSQVPAYVMILQISVLIGFIGAGFVQVGHVKSTLIIAGLMTFIAGILGGVINSRKSVVKGG